MNTEAWDVFMTVSRDSGIVAAQCFEGPMRIVKCLVYLLFFTIIICCAFASKVSLLVMTAGVGDKAKVGRQPRVFFLFIQVLLTSKGPKFVTEQV